MLRQVAAGKECGMYRGMQRFDPSIQELGKPGDLLHIQYRHIATAECRRSATGGDDLPTELHQSPREGNNPSFVADRYQSSLHCPVMGRFGSRPILIPDS
jgi:hypothetical protein